MISVIQSSSRAAPETDIKVLLADDEEMSRRGFSAALEESHGITLVASTRVDAELHVAVESCRPDVVLLNSATSHDWVTMVRWLAEASQRERLKCIVVAGADIDDDCLLSAVHAGAAGVLLRSVSAEELSYAVRHVAAGHSVISPAATSYMLARLRVLAGAMNRDTPGTAAINALSRRERQILAGLASGRSNREIAIETQLTVATVKSHVSSILTKLGVRDRLQAALLGQRAGLAEEFRHGSAPPGDYRPATSAAAAPSPRAGSGWCPRRSA